MKIMLDCSPRKIDEYSKRYNHKFWQLRTPLTGNRIAGVPYGLDNGCFTGVLKFEKWLKMIDEAESDEVCKELGITASNLWVMLHRARLKMRQCLESKWLK